MKRICIIGLGWLGESLAHFYSSKGYEITGTVSSEEKAKSLSQDQLKVIPFALATDPHDLIQQIDISSFDFLVLTLPPSALKTNFAKHFIGLVQVIRAAHPDLPLLYTSSTSVYGNQSGKLNEERVLLPQSNNAHELVKIERFMLEQLDNCYTLRLGGLVGGRRHPVHFLKGRSALSNPQAKVNLVHREDVVQAIAMIEEKKPPFGAYNLVCPKHPTRADFYITVAENLHLSLPKFEANNQTSGKEVVPSKIIECGFTFKYHSPFDFPESKAL